MADWLTALCREGCVLDRWGEQPFYVEAWFEAAAMRAQFEYYTEHVTLRPFRGDYTIPLKFQAARDLVTVSRCYPGKPIVVLYFGDLDPKGLQIPRSAERDVRRYCAHIARQEGVLPPAFEFIRCGLNPGDEVRFALPENFERPGAYQWEALNDVAAGQLITDALVPYVEPAAFDAVAAREAEARERLQALLRGGDAA